MISVNRLINKKAQNKKQPTWRCKV